MILWKTVNQSSPSYPTINGERSRLALGNLLWNSAPHILGHQVVPLELRSRSLTHSRLESLQLSDALKVPHCFNRLFQKIDVRVPLCCPRSDCLKDDRVFVQVLRRAVEPMLEIHLVHVVWVAGALLKHRRVTLRRSITPREPSTYFEKHSEFSVIFHLLLQSLLRRRQLTDVRGVGQSELSGRIEEDIPNSRNDLSLFPLPNVHGLE